MRNKQVFITMLGAYFALQQGTCCTAKKIGRTPRGGKSVHRSLLDTSTYINQRRPGILQTPFEPDSRGYTQYESHRPARNSYSSDDDCGSRKSKKKSSKKWKENMYHRPNPHAVLIPQNIFSRSPKPTSPPIPERPYRGNRPHRLCGDKYGDYTYHEKKKKTPEPTSTPTQPRAVVTPSPSPAPSILQSEAPSLSLPPTSSISPSERPSFAPTQSATNSTLTSAPTVLLSATPSSRPSITKSDVPTVTPSLSPTTVPTVVPSQPPTLLPSPLPSEKPSISPSKAPSPQPSPLESSEPSLSPVVPTPQPTELPPTAGIDVPATPFSLTYEIEGDQPNVRQFRSAELLTLNYLKVYATNQLNMNIGTTVEYFVGEAVGSAIGPPRAGYEVFFIFTPASTAVPTKSEVDNVIETAFQLPSVQLLFNTLQELPEENPFSNTLSVIYTSISDTQDTQSGSTAINSFKRGQTPERSVPKEKVRLSSASIVIIVLIITMVVATGGAVAARLLRSEKEMLAGPDINPEMRPLEEFPMCDQDEDDCNSDTSGNSAYRYAEF